MNQPIKQPVTGEIVPPNDQWSWWVAALMSKTPVETEKGNPRSGYYRLRNEAIAIWREDDGTLVCWRSDASKYTPTKPDEIDDLFAYCAPHPITYEAYQAFNETGKWPEDIEAVAEAPAYLPPHEAINAEIGALREQAANWLKSIGSVQNQEQADKAANYAEAFSKLEARATDAHKTEKAPHLEAGRKVDAAWKPVIERAGELKKWSKKASEAFLIAEKARLAEEDRKRREEAARIAREAEQARIAAEKAGEPPPPAPAPVAPPPAPQKAGAGTTGRRMGLKTRQIVEITDWRAFLDFVANMNDRAPDFVDVCRTMAGRMVRAGVKVPGVETRTEEYAA
jgi:hypothetical protein